MNKPNTTLAAALLCGALTLGGCATTHIGDDWQCPLTQGSPCLGVSDADPAAPGNVVGVGAGARQDAGARQSARALQRTGSRRNADARLSPEASRFAGRRPSGRTPASRPDDNPPESNQPQPADNSDNESAACNAWCRPFAWLWRRGGESAAADDAESDGEAALHGGVELTPAPAGSPDDLRTPEVIGRIWIAPYVDANGVYREASWVRVVLKPARWRLP